jgi:sulfatase modifying factor 1
MNSGPVRALFASFLLICPAPAAPAKLSLAEQFDNILRFPGDYSQNCSSVYSSYPAPLPAFRSIMHAYASLSQSNLDFLRKNRAGVIPILTAKLQAADLLRKPLPQPRDPSVTKKDPEGPEPIGVDPASFNSHLLKIVEELEAVEVIPQLLAIEEKYVPLMEAFEKDPGAPVPQVDGANTAKVFARNLSPYDEEIDDLRKEPKEQLERKSKIFDVQAVQRDLLAVLVRLMRDAGYKPLFTSRLESLYGDTLQKAFRKDEVLSKYKKAEDIPEHDRAYIHFDPVRRLAWHEDSDLGIPYTPELRREILELTKSFIAAQNILPAKKPGPNGHQLVPVPAGDYHVGLREIPTNPPRTAKLAAYLISDAETTNAQFAKFVEVTGYRTDAERRGSAHIFRYGEREWKWIDTAGANWRHPRGPEGPDAVKDLASHPVTSVSAADAAAYCQWAGGRLPTQAEWEVAARAGAPDTDKYPWGSKFDEKKANIWNGNTHAKNTMEDGFEFTAPVRSYPPNAWGLYDVIGNVFEFVSDLPPGIKAKEDQPLTSARGGSWWCSATTCSAYNLFDAGTMALHGSLPNQGFRMAMTPAK